MKKITGRCLCEAISYEITGEWGPVYNCHCSKCRRWHGAAFRTRAAIETKNFKWLSGEKYLSRYQLGGNVKTFCSICGSNLISFFENTPENIGLPLGGLEQDPGVAIQGNLFVNSKAPWYNICDNLPQYAEWPPEGPAVVRNPK